MSIGNITKNSSTRGKYFGTDGFRGEPNVTLTPLQSYQIGRFVGWYYSNKKTNNQRARILIGRDTRLSGFMLEAAIAAGVTTSGADVYLLNVTTTPSISFFCKSNGFDCGVMITASHNPYYDNGIKLINGSGEKLDENITKMIESYLDDKEALLNNDVPIATRNAIGRIYDYSNCIDQYSSYLISTADTSLNNLKIGIDCANGSSYMLAERIFSNLGAKTYVINNNPDGTNINRNCGSTHLEQLQALVIKESLDVGFAFDGDADRCIAVDKYGNVVDGDKLIYIIAKRLKRLNLLNHDTVAVTIMSNLGLIKELNTEGIGVSITPVGDKYVYQRMVENGYQLGGEQSGHIIMKPYSVTGDGILTAIIIANEIIETNCDLSILCKEVKAFPQITVNLKVKDKFVIANDVALSKIVADLNKQIHPTGRILLRASGTEDLIRLTVEAEDNEICENYIQILSQAIKERDDLL